MIGVNSLAAENAMQSNNSTMLWLTNRGSASDYWFGDNKRFEPVTNTVTKAIQNTVVREPYL